MFHVPETARITDGPIPSTAADGNNGAFRCGKFTIIASDGGGWEHVSVSLPNRCPTWGEMCWVKSLFWDPEDAVIQIHPPASQYVNMHPNCLHLWRPINLTLPLPPAIFVGFKMSPDE